MICVADVLAGLDRSALPDTLFLETGPVRIAVRCDTLMANELRHHLADALAAEGPVSAVVDVLNGQKLENDPAWIDWAREPGKTGRKDAYHDLEDGRLVRKIRTGMTFLQSRKALLALGPCLEFPNQVINFINTQILNICKRDGWEICHAAAVTDGVKGLAVAGLSGGGKSTTILRMMDLATSRFVTNDRLMVRATEDGVTCLGIPKNPRINPGTIVGNPRLVSLLPETRRQELAQMPTDDLWRLEEKHDLFITDVYGPGRVQFTMPLSEFWVLNWSRRSASPTRLQDANLADRTDLLRAIMKSAGPFYQDTRGRFLRDDDLLCPDDYLAQLKSVRLREVTGTIDFDALALAGRELFS
ncbi:HprK-related kinase B [Roseibium sp. SCP14]|uniref:HprK-related kinase B n=1 Tax=Roseibium sp. SCP14 TaxID=3141375 RepID=UPI0033356181